MHAVRTVFAVHNHQPIGNFESVFQHAFDTSYRPFLEVMERHPAVRFTQHWTGPLLEWLLERHPGFVDRMRALVRRGQLELLTGAYYEAVLSAIPPEDATGQIRKLTALIEREFGVHPRGMWLAERVWEGQLIRLLCAAGIEFVLLDDSQIHASGVAADTSWGYYVTEDQGSVLKIVPMDATLRYTVPFRPLEDTLEHVRRVSASGPETLLVHADDGEKFGVWPHTHRTVYEEGWLERFCAALEEYQDWIRCSHLGEVLDELPPLGMVYLPAGSYPEMMKWALGASAFQRLDSLERRLKEGDLAVEAAPFVRAGYWKNFLAKYPEANHMHKKMLRLSRRAAELARRQTLPAELLDHLWAGQCNDAYWHGVFGGLYLPNLRHATYSHLLSAERMLDELDPPTPLRVEQLDFDCDGAAEVVVESRRLDLLFKPRTGGALLELDFKPASWNALDILSRREEGYHHRLRVPGSHREASTVHDGVLAKEAQLHEHLHVDWYRHASLVDHVLGERVTLEEMARCAYAELGDFVNQPYTVSVWSAGREVEVTLMRDGALWRDGIPHRLRVSKRVAYHDGSDLLTIDYTLSNLERAPVTVRFGVEFNIGMLAGNAHDRYYEIDGRRPADPRLASRGEDRAVSALRMTDEWLGVEAALEFGTPATLWRFPIETVSLSEAGFERLYQSSVLLPHWNVRLEEHGEFAVTIRHRLGRRGEAVQ